MSIERTHGTVKMVLWAMIAALAVTPLALAGSAARAADEEESALLEHMEQINDGYKLLRRAARRPDRLMTRENIELVATMQEASLHALHTLDFPMLNEVSDDAQRKAMIIQFKTIQGNLLKTLVDLEIALESDDTDKAVELVNGLADLKKEGHDAFVPAE